MKYLVSIIIATTLLVTLTVCGSGNGKEGQTGGKATNEISVVFNDKEQYNPGAFELKKAIGFIAGMRYNAKSTAKHAYVVFANYDVGLGLYTVEMPKETGQIVIMVSFKTENKEIPLEQQMEEYAKMEVPTGTFEPSWMSEGKSFQVTYFIGGESGGPVMSDKGASGTAVLTTSSPEKLIGSIDFTGANGSTIKGTFNVKVEKDLWKR